MSLHRDVISAKRATTRRPPVGRRFRFLEILEPEAKSWHRAIATPPEDIDEATERVSDFGSRLPQGRGGVRKQAWRQNFGKAVGTMLVGYRRLLELFPEIGLSPEKLLVLHRRIARYQSLRQKAARAVHRSLDQRLVLGGVQWYMLRSVINQVTERISQKGADPQEVERLETLFSKLLLHKEALLEERAQSGKDRKETQEEIQKRIEEIELRTLFEDTVESIRQDRPVDRETLLKAARYLERIQVPQRKKAQASDPENDAGQDDPEGKAPKASKKVPIKRRSRR